MSKDIEKDSNVVREHDDFVEHFEKFICSLSADKKQALNEGYRRYCQQQFIKRMSFVQASLRESKEEARTKLRVGLFGSDDDGTDVA